MCGVEYCNAPFMKKIVHRLFNDWQEAGEVGDPCRIGVGKTDRAPVNMGGIGWHVRKSLSILQGKGKESTTPRHRSA